VDWLRPTFSHYMHVRRARFPLVGATVDDIGSQLSPIRGYPDGADGAGEHEAPQVSVHLSRSSMAFVELVLQISTRTSSPRSTSWRVT
jgi:hypothetical protein